MNKLMYRFVATTKKKKRNRPVLRHGMPPQGIPRKKKEIDPFLDTVCPLRASRVKKDACYTGITRDAGADSFIPTVCFAD